MNEKRKLLCAKCGEEMIDARADFTYLGHLFHSEIPTCPKCGKRFISRELAEGKIKEVETILEDK